MKSQYGHFWSHFRGTGDFLIYGLDPAWLHRHPEIIEITQEKQYALVHREGGLVVQTHPFRKRGYMQEIVLHPHHCDAWEVANAGNEPYMDRRAYEYAASHQMRMTCGSDIYTTEKLAKDLVFPMLLDEPLEAVQDYVDRILSGKGFRTGFPKERMNCELQEPQLPLYWVE